VIWSTRDTAGLVTTRRNLVPLSVARRNVRTSALIPAESQNVVVLMSAISADAP
jgi:hypothetical protein